MKIFSVILPVRVSLLLVSEILLTFVCFLIGCELFLQVDPRLYLSEERGLWRILVASLSISLGLFVNDLYAKPRVQSRVALALKLSNVLGIALITQGLLAYLPSGLTLPRAVMLSGAVLTFVSLFLWRIVFSSILLSNVGLQQILFVGADSVTEEIADRVRSRPEMGYRVAGYLAGQADAGNNASSSGHAGVSVGPYLGAFSDLGQVAGRLVRGRIIVADASREAERPLPTLLRLARAGTPVDEGATAFETICGRVCSGKLRPHHIIFFNELPARPGSVALQSIYTNVLALTAIVITSPVLFIAALLVKLTSRGPLLERDLRVGLHGIPFSMHRFRCHRVQGNAQSREQLLTPVGRALQGLRLVHLPRLFNLLRGEITLVGPKPEKPEFAAELSRCLAFYGQRHSIKPGMTGWSQIHVEAEGSRTDTLRQLEYDLYYTKHMSLALDAYILLHGIRALLPFSSRSA